MLNKNDHSIEKMLLIIGYGMDSPDTLKRINDTGLKFVFVQRKELLDIHALSATSDIVITDYLAESFLPLADSLHQHWNFFSVLSLTEAGVEIAAKLNIRWGKPSTSLESIYYLKNKGAMRALLNKHYFSPVHYAVCANGQQLVNFISANGLPVIIKPIDGSGSMGVQLITQNEMLADIVNNIDSGRGDYIVEEFIDGPEYSIECFSFNGQHKVVTITEKISVEEFVEVGHMVPARLAPDVEQQAQVMASQFLNIIGLSNGPSHTEFKVSSKGIRIIESHNRIAGGNVGKLIKRVFDIDMIQLSALWAAREITPDYLNDKTAQGVAIVRFLVLPPGKVKRVQGFEKIKSDEYNEVVETKINYSEGDEIPALEGNSRRSGYIILHGSEAAQILERSMALIKSIKVDIVVNS